MFDDRKPIRCKRFLANLLFAGGVFLCSSGSVLADLLVTKTIAPATAQPAPEGSFIFYNIDITNTELGALTNVVIDDALGLDLNNLVFQNAPLGGSQTGPAQFTIPNMSAGQSTTLNVRATVNGTNACPVIQNSASVSEDSATFSNSDAAPSIEYDFEFTSGQPGSVVTHLATSFCELCGTGLVTIRVQNPTTAALTNITIVEDLQASGLDYIPGSTTVTSGTTGDPGGGMGPVLTWTGAQLSALNNLAAGASVDITFGVSRLDEGLLTADRNIFATADFDVVCVAARQSVNTGQFEVPINQPEPVIIKDGRNVDAGQSGYDDPVFGNANDDVIWRVNVRNAGDANMEALRMNDSINGNFTISSICPTEASALATANANGAGAPIAPCIAMTSPFNVIDPFGNAADPDDIAANTNTTFIYYVGRILAGHTDNTNTNDISWGCIADSPTGGSITVPASNGGATPSVVITDTGDINTTVVPANLSITQTVTGTNTSQPLGTKGLVTVTIDNQTGGTIRDIQLRDVVPAGYVVDGTFGSQVAPANCDCNVTYTPAFGATYPGFIDTVVRDDVERDNGDPLDDTDPSFTFTSSTVGDNDGSQANLMRNGDVIVLTFGIVMVDSARFDVVADLDLAPEVAPGTDPTNALALINDVFVDFNSADAAGVQGQTQNDTLNFNSNPEDLDVAISDALFILTNDPGTPLDLNIVLTNNGGHDADDYILYVTLGQAMTVQLPLPAGCVGPGANPPAQPHWNDPADIPSTANVYSCDRGVIGSGAGAAETFTFTVIKTDAPAFDDLTFRADIFGEVTLFDGSLLTSPPPPTIPDTTPNVAQLANNYSFDAIRSRVLGFNLVKNAWYCAEDGLAEPAVPANVLSSSAAAPNLPSLTGDLNSEIGEDCNYRIESGGWFGFVTPGFTLIEVQDVTVTEDLPDGQGFIAFSGGSSFNFTSTVGISLTGVDGGAGSMPLDETDIVWGFNAAGTGIGVANEFFRVDFKTRLLNDPVDLSYPVGGLNLPNLHGNTSSNVATTSFTAIFQSDPIGGVVQPIIPIVVDETLNVPGYPAPAVRTVDLTEVEPNLIVTKQVCNETLSSLNGDGTGDLCIPFADSINNGDTNDSYVYRITLENQTSAPVRSPAFNVTTTDTLDSADLLLVIDFASDGLDNDGDTAIDEADEAALFASIPDNVLGNATPAVITVDESFNAQLTQIDPGPGNAVTYYYRVDPDITISPLQTLTNTVSMSFDSLDGDFGNQNTPQLDNNSVTTAGRARIYTSIAQTADVIMIPLVAQPIVVTDLSNSLPVGAAPHNVSVGEEIRYQLTAELPVANLRQFRIRNELPVGLSCSEIQTVNLSTDPEYAGALFNPGGPPQSTQCTTTTAGNDIVEWFFGDQAITASLPGNRFIFVIDYVARVENIDSNREATALTNGGVPIDNPAACTSVGGGGGGVCYVDDVGTAVALDFAPVDVVVREPEIVLTKVFAPVGNSDAGDILTVTVTAENTGTAAAYNLQIRDDLSITDLTYINDSMAGADAPDDDGVAADSKLPTFTWNIANPDYEILTGAGNAKTFTFQVRVDTTAQPLELLDNTIQAKWDSLPDLNTALNIAPGTIGVDGSNFGLRNGVLPNNPADTLNDYETTATDSTSVLPLTLNKNDLNAALIPAVGAHKNFEIVITLPEGTTNNLVVNDDLIFSGLSYALSRNVSFDVSYTFTDIASINGGAADESVFTGQGLGTLPADNDTGTIEWNIGTVITAEEDDATVNAVDPTITINYFARVNNDAVTDDGDTLQNSATLTYDNGETAAIETLNDTTGVQTVVEPLLVFNPAITISNLTSPGVLPDSGDILEYQITVENTGTSEAFDVNVVSTLSAQLLFDTALPIPTALIGGAAVPGFTTLPAASPAGPLIWGRDNADNTLDIPAGDSLVLTYRVVVQNVTEPNTDLDTTITVDWTSIDDTDLPNNLFERTGTGCPLIVEPDDYCLGPQIAQITTIDNNNIIKSIILDTYDTGLSTAIDSIARVGDIVTYRLEVAIQEGTTRAVNVVDTMDTGMTFVDILSINGDATADYDPPGAGAGSNFSYATLTVPGSVPVAGDTGIITWTFGDVVNDEAGDASTDTIVIEYRARVTKDTIPQQPLEVSLTNTVDLNYIDADGVPSDPSASPPDLRDTSILTVKQPLMVLSSKIDRSGRLSGDTVNIATDVMNFRLETCNTDGEAPAYGLKIIDTLPFELDETSITNPVVTIGGSAAALNTDYTYVAPARGGDMVFTFMKRIDPGACVRIDFDISFHTDIGFGSFSNQVNVMEYFSKPSSAEAQRYDPLVPESFTMNNPAVAIPGPAKSKLSADEATIGDVVTYQITVPSTPVGTILHNVTITDTIDSSLVFIDATDPIFTVNSSIGLPNEVIMVIGSIPAGQQAVIELRARVDNNTDAIKGLTFDNTTRYTYTDTPALPTPPAVPNNGGNATTNDPLTIVEPFVAVTRVVPTNATKAGPPDAGDILRYTLTLRASGGEAADLFSDAFDISIADSLSLGQVFSGNPTVDGAGNTINAPTIVGDGIATAQTLDWTLADGNADIDIVEGTVVTVTYEVLVLDEVQASQDLTSTVNVQWHSRDGPDVPAGSGEGQRDGSGVPALNNYFNVDPVTTLLKTPDNNTITKARITDTFDGTNNVRIGDIIEYELRINVQEGTNSNFVVQDNLPQGLVFEETININNTTAPFIAAVPFTHSDIAAPIVVGNAATGPTTVTWSATDLVNLGDNLANNDFVIRYSARVLNLAHPQVDNITLSNTVNVDYDTVAGAAPTETDNEVLNLQQPNLSITKVVAPANGDTVIDAGEAITYTIEITNNGTAPAYDVELIDVIPFGLRQAGITSPANGTRLLVAGTILPNITPVLDGLTGEGVWDFDSGVADQYNIPAGDTLQIVYLLQADAGLGTGVTLTNQAQVRFYYSFDNDDVPVNATVTGVREIYGPSNIASVSLSTDVAGPLLKTNSGDIEISIGETFNYTIVIPEVLQSTAMYDVRVLDDLTASANLAFVSASKVSGSLTWTPVNTGTANNVVIEDTVNGIDIPANEQVEIRLTVVLTDTVPPAPGAPFEPNEAGLLFNNSANYTFNQIDNNAATVLNGLPSTTVVDRLVVEPNLTLVKDGPNGLVNFAAPIPYMLTIENIGDGPAFDTTVVDQLVNVTNNPPLVGGICDREPENTVANITLNNGTTVVRALTLGVDYTAVHTAEPTCEFVITTLTSNARLEPTEKLVITYDTFLDIGSQSGAQLINTAGVARWFSLDTAGAGATGEIREYTSTLISAAPIATVEAAILETEKIAINLTSGQIPTPIDASVASPGDVLRYTITVSNTGEIDAGGVMATDVIPANVTYIADSVTLNGAPVGQPDGGVSPLATGIDINSSNAPPSGVMTAGEVSTVAFDVILDAVISSGTVISNQAMINSLPTGLLFSDDPNIGGATDPTLTTIISSPVLQVQKTSQDISGDATVLIAGDTLRYTLTVKNIGQENAVNNLLSDQIPANTSYVANSTTLNGVAVADPTAGISALAAGMLINAPEDSTAGFLRADTDVAADNVATITFEVVTSNTVIDGTIISNQGFLSGEGTGSGAFPQQPSDDPATALVDDPTLDVVGNVAVVDVLKTVVIQNDINGNGEVDPGDTLRYTITTSNIGAAAATGVSLLDPAVANATYVVNTTTLNGLAVADVGISSALVTGIAISSDDLTPPLPSAGAGTLTAGQSAVVIFDVQVDAGATPGTIISNQGTVSSNGLLDEPSDADGNDANGDQPTEVVVGNVQRLTMTKQVLVVGGGVAQAGNQLEYILRVTNIGSVVAGNVVITDDLNALTAIPGQVALVSGANLLDGLTIGDNLVGSVITLNIGNLSAAAVTELRFRVLLDASLNIGDTVSNTGTVNWDAPVQTASATVDIGIGGAPGTANLNGTVWHDTDFDNVIDASEVLLQDWTVDLYRNNTLLASTLTNGSGVFAFAGLAPNLPTGDAYELRYFIPGAIATTASLGQTDSVFTDGPQRITDIFAASGSAIQDLNLPRQPNGIVYDSVQRIPVAGVQLTMVNQTQSNQSLSANCFTDVKQQNQVTLAEGYYKFDLVFGDSSCAENDEYVIDVLPPADDFAGTTSVIIPPVVPIAGNALDVINCPGNVALDKITATAEHCENSASAIQPPDSIEPRTSGTDYHLKFEFNNSAPVVTNQIFNNHIPVDPKLEAAVSISKVAGFQNVTRSQLVPYTITLNNTLNARLFDLNVVDNFPAGFKYVASSSRVDGEEVEPLIEGRQLTWTNLNIEVGESRIIKLLLVVGSGVSEGEYVNTAQIINSLNNEPFSGVASATVQVIPDPTFDCTDIIGKVFDDANNNAYHDQGETGLAGVQLATARGLRVTTDEHGRFHITCAIVPDEIRGSNFIMKVDDRTLPTGYRITTENPRVQRATRGKMMKFNFGATIHRVVRLDLADGVFEEGTTELRPQWRSRIDLLIIELQKDPSILRLSYLGENETESDVEDRLDAIEELISDRWQALDCCYKLTIEQEVFWRKGNPSDRLEFAR